MRAPIGMLLGAVLAAGLLSGCSNGKNVSVSCFTDKDCPADQRCVAGACELKPDGGPTPCQQASDCQIDEFCENGICTQIPDEPRDEAGGDDGGQVEDGDDGPDAGDDEVDQGPDEDARDFSHWNFSIAVRRGGTSGPANQCINSLNPPANAGPVIDPASATGGYTLSGAFRDSGGAPLPGAKVELLTERPACVPAPVTTDGSGGFSFYLAPGGPYKVQAIAADGRVGHLRVASLQANTSQDIQLPDASNPLTGGPLCDGQPCDQIQANWTVEAWFVDGVNAGKLAHAGVITTDQLFSIPVTEGVAYDLIATPAAGGPVMPRQVVLEQGCQEQNGYDCANEGDIDRTWLRVRPGNALTGVASAGGTGAPQSVVTAADYIDARMVHTAAAVTGGSYQLQLPVSSFNLTAQPSPTAFEAGAMLFYSPQQTIVADSVKELPMAIGQRVEISGRIIDGGGGGVGDAQVQLIVNDTPMIEGSYAWCDPNWVSTSGDGSFTAVCNLTP